MIFRVERFLLLFWRTFSRTHTPHRLQGNFVFSVRIVFDGTFKLLQVRLVRESHSIVFAPKISDQLGVIAKEGIILCIAEGA